MKLMENKKKLADAMEDLMKTDRAKHSVLPITKFGLMQITRQRMKPEMKIDTSELCPSCNGSGTVSSTLIMEDEIAKNLNYLIMQKHKGLTIVVHPIMYTYLTCGFPSRKWIVTGLCAFPLQPAVGADFLGGDPAAGSPTATLLRLLPPCLA